MQKTPLTKAQKTRLKILNAASRHLSAFGYRGALIRDICKEAGYSTGALYNHFVNKEDLFKEAFRHGAQKLQVDIATTMGIDPKKQLKKIAKLTVKHRVFLRLFDADAQHENTHETAIFLTELKKRLKLIAPKLNSARLIHRLQLSAALLRSPVENIEQWPKMLFFAPEPQRRAA